MKDAMDFAEYFIQHGADTPPNTFDGNMKLQKLLYFANMVSYAKYNTPLFNNEINAFENGCVIEPVRKDYQNKYKTMVERSKSKTLEFTKQEQDILFLTTELYGSLSGKELSVLNHKFGAWEHAYNKALNNSALHPGYLYKADSVVSNDAIKRDAERIKPTIEALEERLRSNVEKETINGVTFFYNPDEIKMTDEMRTVLDNYAEQADEQVYSVCYDEDGELMIF